MCKIRNCQVFFFLVISHDAYCLGFILYWADILSVQTGRFKIVVHHVFKEERLFSALRSLECNYSVSR